MRSASNTSPPGRERLYAALEAERGSAYLLGVDLSLQYVNAAWRRFAQENGAPGLAGHWQAATPITSFFDQPLRGFFSSGFVRVLTTNQAWSYSYDCSSSQRTRKFNMRVVPTTHRDGLIVVHSRLYEPAAGATYDTSSDLARAYTDARGLTVHCSGCRRVHHPADSSWDWVPALLVREQENTSHGICPTCEFQYYGQEGSSI